MLLTTTDEDSVLLTNDDDDSLLLTNDDDDSVLLTNDDDDDDSVLLTNDDDNDDDSVLLTNDDDDDSVMMMMMVTKVMAMTFLEILFCFLERHLHFRHWLTQLCHWSPSMVTSKFMKMMMMGRMLFKLGSAFKKHLA